MKNFILCFVVCCTFLLFGMEVNAATFEVPYAEPTYDLNHGYIILEYENGAREILFWGANAMNKTSTDPETYITNCNLNIQRSGITFTFISNYTDAEMHFYLCRYNSSDVFDKIVSKTVDNGVYVHEFTSGVNISGYTFKGNVGAIVTGFETANTKPVMLFGDDPTPQILSDILEELSVHKGLFENYVLKFVRMNLTIESLETELKDLKSYIEEYYPMMYDELYYIDSHLSTIKYYLLQQNSSDKQNMDNFKDSSSSQTNDLNNLNNWKDQYETTVPLDQLNDSVDDNLNVDIDADYGMLLSTFTTNNRILTMLLMVASVSLISYVLFGKR